MFSSLASFYKSRQWEALIGQIRLDRVNENGDVICEHCGRPISKAYDMIGHHIVELTEENVNDYNVSLNPENVKLVHHKCHNLIHDKLGYSERQVFLVYGPPFAGKREWVQENMGEGDLVLEMDSLWQAVSGFPRYVKPNRLRSVVFRLREDIYDVIKYRYGKWMNAYIIGGYPLIGERERIVKDFGAREVFIEKSREECIYDLYTTSSENSAIDVKEYEGYIDEWFTRYSPPVGS